jgi:hypothetical protein
LAVVGISLGPSIPHCCCCHGNEAGTGSRLDLCLRHWTFFLVWPSLNTRSGMLLSSLSFSVDVAFGFLVEEILTFNLRQLLVDNNRRVVMVYAPTTTIACNDSHSKKQYHDRYSHTQDNFGSRTARPNGKSQRCTTQSHKGKRFLSILTTR